MPTDQLAAPDMPVAAVLQVLAGQPTASVAEQHHLHPADLREAVDTYHLAGSAALQANPQRGWHQVHLRFPDRQAATRPAAAATVETWIQQLNTVDRWWYICKAPHWRIRLTPASTTAAVCMIEQIEVTLDQLKAAGAIAGWRTGLYEPELSAFGGPTAMAIAHQLFTVDSAGAVSLLSRADPPVGRRELSLLLCQALLAGARLEWYERGDVWQRVAATRPLPQDIPTDRVHQTAEQLQPLLISDPTPGSGLFEQQPLSFAANWAAGFHQAGRDLAAAAESSTLRRGLRAILAHLIIFHWNRLLLPTRRQAILAHAATSAILHHV